MNHSVWIDWNLLIEDEAEQVLNSIHYCLVNQWDHEFDVETQYDRFLRDTKNKIFNFEIVHLPVRIV